MQSISHSSNVLFRVSGPELRTVLSGKAKCPPEYLFNGSMLNLPTEFVYTLNYQLVYVIDWAIEHVEGGMEEQKSLDFGVFVRIAPCIQQG